MTMCFTSSSVPVSRRAGIASAFWITEGRAVAAPAPSSVRRRKSRRSFECMGLSGGQVLKHGVVGAQLDPVAGRERQRAELARHGQRVAGLGLQVDADALLAE